MYLNNEQIEESLGETHAWWLREILDDDEQVLWAAQAPMQRINQRRPKWLHPRYKIVFYPILFTGLAQFGVSFLDPTLMDTQNLRLIMTMVAIIGGIFTGMAFLTNPKPIIRTYAITDRRIIRPVSVMKKDSAKAFRYSTYGPDILKKIQAKPHPHGGGDILFKSPSGAWYFNMKNLPDLDAPLKAIKQLQQIHESKQPRTGGHTAKGNPSGNNYDTKADNEKLLWSRPPSTNELFNTVITFLLFCIIVISLFSLLIVITALALIPIIILSTSLMLAFTPILFIERKSLQKTYYRITTKHLIVSSINWRGVLQQKSFALGELIGLEVTMYKCNSSKIYPKSVLKVQTFPFRIPNYHYMQLRPKDIEAVKLLRNFIERRD